MGDDRVWVGTVRTNHGSPKVVHTDADCHILDICRNPREVNRQRFPNRPVCKFCSGEYDMSKEGNPQDKSRTCRSCGSEKEPDGTCEFCEWYEEAMGPYA